MQTNDFYENVLVIHAYWFRFKQKFSEPQHHFKQMCGTAYFVEHVESETFGATGGSRWPKREKSARTKRGIRSVASNEPFFGTDTRWEPVLN